jgi:hypothetical protein
MRICNFSKANRSFPLASYPFAALFILLACGLAGCRKSRLDALPPVFAVEGEIYVNGKPAHGAVIAFHPKKKAEGPISTSRGVADSLGKFALTTFVAGDGAPEGEYVVTVYWPQRPLNPHGESDPLPADKLGGRFASPTQSKLRARIEKQPTRLARIDLADQSIERSPEFYFSAQPD